MKQFTVILTVLALIGSNTLSAQNTTPTTNYKSGQGATESSSTGSQNGFAWGIGLGALAVIGTVVGLAASSASSSPSSFSH